MKLNRNTSRVRTILTASALLALVAGSAIGELSGEPSEEVRSLSVPSQRGAVLVTFVVDGETMYSDAPTELPVYAVGGDALSQADVLQIATLLVPNEGMMIRDFDVSKHAWYLSDNDNQWHLTIADREGRFSLKSSAAGATDQSDALPDLAEAIERAEQWLEQRGLLPQDSSGAWTPVEHQLGWRNRLADQGSTSVWAFDVRLGREVSEHPAFGPGTKLYVQFNGPDVSAVTVNWPALVPDGTKSLAPISTAIQRASEGNGDFEGATDCSEAVINQAHIAYYVPGLGGSRSHAFPAYEIEATCIEPPELAGRAVVARVSAVS